MQLSSGPDARKLAQVARCMLLGKAHDVDALQIAEKLYGDRRNQSVVDTVKAAVDGHGTTGTGSELSQPRLVASEFAASVRPMTVLGKLSGVIRIPFSTPLSFISTRTQFEFVAERQPIPSVAPGFSDFNLPQKKVGGLIVLSRELLESSRGEEVLTNEMISGCVEAIDRHLLDATDGDSARPAAVNFDSDPIFQGSGGPTVPQLDQLTYSMLQTLVTAGSNLQRAAFVTSTKNCSVLASYRDSGGGLAYPTITAKGGLLAGLPLIASSAATGLTLLDAGELVVADDDETEITTSSQAFISQSDSPGSENVWTSLFQTENLGLKVVRLANWRLRNPYVSYATGFNLLPTSAGTT